MSNGMVEVRSACNVTDVPSSLTIAAIQECREGQGERFSSVQDLMTDLLSEEDSDACQNDAGAK